jgi:hypothetical protein
MKQTTLSSTVTTKTIVANSTATASIPGISTTNSKINVQTIGPAQDNSGKTAYQYSALIGTGDGMFVNTAAAERNCIESATFNGHMQYARVAAQPGTFAIVAW